MRFIHVVPRTSYFLPFWCQGLFHGMDIPHFISIGLGSFKFEPLVCFSIRLCEKWAGPCLRLSRLLLWSHKHSHGGVATCLSLVPKMWASPLKRWGPYRECSGPLPQGRAHVCHRRGPATRLSEWGAVTLQKPVGSRVVSAPSAPPSLSVASSPPPLLPRACAASAHGTPPQRECKSWAESNRSGQPPGQSRSAQVSGSRGWDPTALPLTLNFSRSFPGEQVNKLLCRFGQLGLASCYLPQRELWWIRLGSFSPNWSGDSNKEGLSRVSPMRNCFHIHHFIPPS